MTYLVLILTPANKLNLFIAIIYKKTPCLNVEATIYFDQQHPLNVTNSSIINTYNVNHHPKRSREGFSHQALSQDVNERNETSRNRKYHLKS